MNASLNKTYWVLVGILFGVGAMLIFSMGIGLVLAGIALAIYGAGKKPLRPDGVSFSLGLAAMLAAIAVIGAGVLAS